VCVCVCMCVCEAPVRACIFCVLNALFVHCFLENVRVIVWVYARAYVYVTCTHAR